jgi:hypothetical protein
MKYLRLEFNAILKKKYIFLRYNIYLKKIKVEEKMNELPFRVCKRN